MRELDVETLPSATREIGQSLAQTLRENKAILGIFDEGCMGMYNAIIEDELLNACSIYKERLLQSALVAAMRLVTEDEARAGYQWLIRQGMQAVTGSDETTELTETQILEQ